MSERPNEAPEDQADDLADAPEPDSQDAAAGDGDVDEEFESDLDEGDAAAGENGDEEFEDEDESPAQDAADGTPAVPRLRPSERRALKHAEHSQLTIDPSLRIKDRASAIFVLVTLLVFGAILLNGLVLGTGGLLTPLPTLAPLPTPTVTIAP